MTGGKRGIVAIKRRIGVGLSGLGSPFWGLPWELLGGSRLKLAGEGLQLTTRCPRPSCTDGEYMACLLPYYG
jgi:hypothetical protein